MATLTHHHLVSRAKRALVAPAGVHSALDVLVLADITRHTDGYAVLGAVLIGWFLLRTVVAFVTEG